MLGLSMTNRRRLARLLVSAMAAMMLASGALAESSDGRGIKRNYNVGRDAGNTYQSTPYNSRAVAPTSTEVVEDFSVRPMLTADSVRWLENAIAQYEIIVSRGGWPAVPKSRTLVKGSEGGTVAVLNQRLALEGYLPAQEGVNPSHKFTTQTQEAVRQFQLRHGLYAHGRVDEATRRELSVPAAVRLETLRANLPRVKEYTQGLADRYILVNIPATQLDVVNLGILHSRHNIVVGKPDRPSPVLKSHVTEINFNPYWNAPVSIVKKDIIPKMLKNMSILDQLNIKVYDGYNGPEIDPRTVDWATADPERYHFRQEPGGENAMASVKINFPNKYAVYMHDTPTKQLFTESQRYFSSGCVRVDKVHILTQWILSTMPGWDKAHIDEVVQSGERLDVEVVNGPEVIYAYLTAWADGHGPAHFREDIYHLDGTGFVSGQPEAVAG